MTLNKKNNQTNKLYAAAPLAQQISWQPIQKNGQPLKNMILQSIEGTLEFHLNILSKFFYFSIMIMGIDLTVYATIELLSYDFHNTFWSALLGFTFICVGIYMFSKQALAHVFDKEKNVYFKQNEKLKKEDEVPLSNIKALQVIAYTEEEKRQAELNLILKDGKRVYVCSYDANDYARVEQDVKKISSYIDKPVFKKEVA